MNHLVLTGNLGADPESFYTPNEGTHIASFNLAFRSTKDKTGWIKVSAFNKLAELVEKHLHKGARVGVAGMLDQEKWETDSGEKRSAFKLIASSVEFIKTDGRGFDGKKNPDEDVPF